jgi:methionyl-tRNA formyltransferase
VRIDEVNTAPDVRAKVGEAVVPLLRRNLEQAISGQLRFEAQDDSNASFCRKIKKEDAALDFNQPAQDIDCRLRACTPWPGAYFDHGPVRVKVGRASWLPVPAAGQPGTVLVAGNTLDVATGDGVLQIHELQRPGGRMLAVKEFLRGFQIEPGTVLPSVAGEDLLRCN